MKSDIQQPTVKMVTDAFFECVDDLTKGIEHVLEAHKKAAQPEKAYHVNRLIRRWFTSGGQL